MVRAFVFKPAFAEGERRQNSKPNLLSCVWNCAKPNLLFVLKEKLEVLLYFRTLKVWEGQIALPTALSLDHWSSCCSCIMLWCIGPVYRWSASFFCVEINMRMVSNSEEACVVHGMFLFHNSLSRCNFSPVVYSRTLCACTEVVLLLDSWNFGSRLLLGSSFCIVPCSGGRFVFV